MAQEKSIGGFVIAVASKLHSYIVLVRVPNAIMIGLAVIVGEGIALGTLPQPYIALFGFLTASLMMAGTMVMNDVYDLDVDRLNSPGRPIPSGKVNSREALIFSIFLSALAIVFSFLTGLLTGLTALLAVFLMAYYNTRGKKTGVLGNAVVSFNVALPFFYGGLAVGSLRPLLYTFSAMAFLANLGREVAKGIPDVEGDRAQGFRTVAVSFGSNVAGIASSSLFLAAVGLSALPPLLEKVSILYFPGVVLADAGFLFSAYSLATNSTPGEARKVKTQVLLWMLFGLIGFLLSRVSP